MYFLEKQSELILNLYSRMAINYKLNIRELRSALAKYGLDADLYFFDKTDSTNLRVHELMEGALRPQIVLAASQTLGRGRFERAWFDEAGKSICLSVGFPLEKVKNTSALSSFALVSGLFVCEALSDFFETPLKLKWPNDIYFKSKKLSGMIADIDFKGAKPLSLVFGIGVNYAPLESPEGLLFSSLLEASSKKHGISETSALIVYSIFKAYQALVSDGKISALPERFARHDYLFGKQISLKCGDNIVEGRARGINASGSLILEGTDGKEILASAGESSVIK